MSNVKVAVAGRFCKPVLQKVLVLLCVLGPIASDAFATEQKNSKALYIISSLVNSVEVEVGAMIEDQAGFGSNITVTGISLEDFRDVAFLDSTKSELLQKNAVVALGKSSCSYVASLMADWTRQFEGQELESWKPDFPRVVCAFVPSSWMLEFDAGSRKIFDAFFLVDQPASRQIKAVRHYFPTLKKLGIMLASDHENTSVHWPIDRDLRDYVEINYYDDSKTIKENVARSIENVDALMLIPDSEVYSTENLQDVLLTTYVHNKPVVGYGKALVSAGSLFSTYSSLEQVTTTLLEVLMADVLCAFTQSINFPKYFHVTNNATVASTMNISEHIRIRENSWFTDEIFLP